MTTEYTYYGGENARFAWNDSKKLLRRYKKWEKISDEELLALLNRVTHFEVDANAHGWSTQLKWSGDFGSTADIGFECSEDEWIKLFMNALPRLRQLLSERASQ